MSVVERKIRALIVDDSAMVRHLLRQALSRDPEIEVVGAAADPYAARALIIEQQPDVLTLDLEMPRMDGLTFLRILMQHHPVPVIVLSSLTQAGTDFALDALEAGAVEVLAKPNGSESVGALALELPAKVKAAARSRRRSAVRPAAALAAPRAASFHPEQLILLGASTGGTEALKEVLMPLPAEMPGICIVQHIPAHFCAPFAERLNQLCRLEVRLARDGDRVTPGTVLIAPGDFHLLLHWREGHYHARLNQSPKIWHQRPAVDLLFRSAAAHAGPHTVAGLLTGMGADGAAGLGQLREAGARTFAQDEATCVVYGMPRVAHEMGAAERMLPLDRVAGFLVHASQHAMARQPGGRGLAAAESPGRMAAQITTTLPSK